MALASRSDFTPLSSFSMLQSDVLAPRAVHR